MSEIFDNSLLDGVDPSTGSKEIPDDGDYNVTISESVYDSTSSGGKGFKMKLTIIDGQYAGNEINHFINIINKNDQAQNIGRAELKSIMTVVKSEDANDLVGKTMRVRLVGEESSWVNKYGAKQYGVNMRVKLIMDTAGKNAKGEVVPEFVVSTVSAKEAVAKKRAQASQSQSNNDGTSQQSQTTGESSSDVDDSIPF